MNRVMDEWSMFKGSHSNTLLIGSDEAAEAAVAQHRRYLRAPIVDWHPRTTSEPAVSEGTLVIRDVDTLDRSQQEQLFNWLDRHAGSVQVVSIAESSLFALVEAGAFLEKLYYRLNVVCLSLAADNNRRAVPQAGPFVSAQSESEVPQLAM